MNQSYRSCLSCFPVLVIPRWAQNLNKDTYQTFDITLVSTGTASSWCLPGNFLAHIFPFPDRIMGNTKELLSLYLTFQKEKKICYSDFHKLLRRAFLKYSDSRKIGKCARAVFIVEPVFAKVVFFCYTSLCDWYCFLHIIHFLQNQYQSYDLLAFQSFLLC